jgi:hydroxymethylglutaryl-CoA lyase
MAGNLRPIMSDMPSSVEIIEEGPREGFQSEPPLPTADKIKLIEALADTGLREINTCSFVNPRRVPQMADAEQIAAGIRRRQGVRYTGLWLNAAGFERARATPLSLVGTIGISASETFGVKNNGRDRQGLLQEQREVMGAYAAAGVAPSTGYIFTSFGCNYEGEVAPAKVVAAVSDVVGLFAEASAAPAVVYLCDTIGSANPRLVERVVSDVRAAHPGVRLGLHLHDTRGLGLANALAALHLGIDRFDTSVGGLGGCPFAGNTAAAGNICTEDLAWLCESMGVATGLDLEALAECAALAESIVGHPLPGKFRNVGRPRLAP